MPSQSTHLPSTLATGIFVFTMYRFSNQLLVLVEVDCIYLYHAWWLNEQTTFYVRIVAIFWGYLLFLYFLFLRHTKECSVFIPSSVLKYQSWQCSGTKWGARDKTQVSHMQGPTCLTISVPSEVTSSLLIFTCPSPKLPQGILFLSSRYR